MGAITRGFANNITTSGKLLQSSISGGLGLTGADQWRVTSDFTPGGNVTANWERNDTNFDKIGTGMSESSGIFTFPDTGIWYVTWDVTNFHNGSSRELQTRIAMTTNNSSYANVVENGSFLQQTDSNTTYAHGNANAIVDITNVSTHKVKFYFQNTGSVGNADGSSTENKTWATFLRLGDT
tara:strand:- start:360 stop:902 length:543 start_codon:yes stop_codon:yes gene_type:complete